MLEWYPSIVPVEIKMVILCKSDNKINPRVNKGHMNVRVSGTVPKRKFQKRQLPSTENQFLDGSCIKLDSLSDPDKLISSCELECGHLLAVLADSDSNGAQPGVVIVGVVRNKESIHLKLVIADQVEGGVALTLEGVAEQSSSRQPDGKMWVRANASLSLINYNKKKRAQKCT